MVDHPDICGSDVKEVFFWNRGENLRYPNLVQYSEHFCNCDGVRYTLDSTPRYFNDLADNCVTLKRHLGEDLRVIIVLRNPVDRLFSFFKFKKRSLEIKSNEPFEEFVEKCLDEKYQKKGLYDAIGDGKYAVPLRKWHETYGGNLKVLFFDDLVNSPDVTTCEVVQWLNLGPDFYDNYDFKTENKSLNYKNKTLHAAGIKFYRRFERDFLRNKTLRHLATNAYYKLNGVGFSDRINAETHDRLEEIYGPSLGELEQLLSEMGVHGKPNWVNLKGKAHG